MNKYITEVLESFAFDILDRSINLPVAIDKTACILTAFMEGQLLEARRSDKAIDDYLEWKGQNEHID